MNTQMIICMVIFAATLVSYMLNKIPMWLTALISMAALYITGCIDDAGALSGFSNVNTLLMACMFIVAAGFRRTSLVDGMCNSIMKLTHGSFKMAYFGYILLAVLLTNFISSPMVVYAIISPLLAALCDKTGNSRTQYMFPIMVVCVACCGILPLATSIQMAGQFTGFMETYGFSLFLSGQFSLARSLLRSSRSFPLRHWRKRILAKLSRSSALLWIRLVSSCSLQRLFA